MKNIIFILLTFLMPLSLLAIDKEVIVTTTIKSVTVYLSGAEIHRATNLWLEEGRSILKFKQLSPKINPASIIASVKGNVKIISMVHQLNFLSNQKENHRINILQDSLEDLSYKLEKIKMEKSSLSEERNILTENRSRLGKENGVSTAELMSATTFYRTKLNEINTKLLYLNVQERKLSADVTKIRLQLEELKNIEKRLSSEIFVTVDASAALRTQVELKYMVKDAAWSPKYDLRTQGAEGKIELDYRAEVLNNTDEEWPNVKLILSTADPSRNMEKPTLQPWGLSYSRNRKGKVNPYTTSGNEGILNTWQPKPDDNTADHIKRKVEVSYSEIEISELSIDFLIKEPYSIFPDGKIYLVDVNEYKLDATYNYFTIPKIDKDAFLIAKIVGWESLNLIEGPANIYFNGTYIGQTVLDTKYSNDTLELSMGRDRKVSVNRVKRQDFNSNKVIGMNRSETFTYEIDVRNTNAVPILIEIQDQVPITQESDIEINITEISGAEHDPVSGKLIWKTSLAPSESKKLTVTFTIKYPKNKDIIIRKSRVVACPKFRS